MSNNLNEGVKSSDDPTKLKKGGEGAAFVSSGEADEKLGKGIVPNHKGGKSPSTAGRKYWKEIKGNVVRISTTYYSKEKDGWYEIYWNGDEAVAAIAKLAKMGTTTLESKKIPTKVTYAKKFFGKKYKRNPAVTVESEDRSRFKNQLGTMSTDQLESFLNIRGTQWPEGDWHHAMCRQFAKHHGLQWPKPVREDFSLLPDPGIKVNYEDINSLVVDEEAIQNDTKCTLDPKNPKKKRALKEWGEDVDDVDAVQDTSDEPDLYDTWKDDQDGEFIQINNDDTVWYVAHGRPMEKIFDPRGADEDEAGGYRDQVFAAIRAWTEANGYSPNVWAVNDHGNATLFDYQGNDLGGIV